MLIGLRDQGFRAARANSFHPLDDLGERGAVVWKIAGGGNEVNEAAQKIAVKPMPISTSAKRRVRASSAVGSDRRRRTARKFRPPRSSKPLSSAILAQSMTP